MRLGTIAAATAMTLLTALGGCVSQGPFPSLAPRPGEGDFVLAEPSRPAPAVADDPALRRQVEALRADAAAGGRSFEAEYEGARAVIARSGPEGSDAWVEAQQALSRLEAARAATTEALTRLDALASARADLPTSRDDFARIEAAIGEAERIDQAQQARIVPLREALTPR